MQEDTKSALIVLFVLFVAFSIYSVVATCIQKSESEQPQNSDGGICLKYFKKEGDRRCGILYSDCGICLEDFKEGDPCRILPTCKHMFHLDCVDPWLKKEKWCPNCRSPYAPTEVVPFKKGITAASVGFNVV
ncbi:hypothetical protein AAC387_Pa04g1640 [Persea americana]